MLAPAQHDVAEGRGTAAAEGEFIRQVLQRLLQPGLGLFRRPLRGIGHAPQDAIIGAGGIAGPHLQRNRPGHLGVEAGELPFQVPRQHRGVTHPGCHLCRGLGERQAQPRGHVVGDAEQGLEFGPAAGEVWLRGELCGRGAGRACANPGRTGDRARGGLRGLRQGQIIAAGGADGVLQPGLLACRDLGGRGEPAHGQRRRPDRQGEWVDAEQRAGGLLCERAHAGAGGGGDLRDLSPLLDERQHHGRAAGELLEDVKRLDAQVAHRQGRAAGLACEGDAGRLGLEMLAPRQVEQLGRALLGCQATLDRPSDPGLGGGKPLLRGENRIEAPFQAGEALRPGGGAAIKGLEGLFAGGADALQHGFDPIGVLDGESDGDLPRHLSLRRTGFG